ncbi:MAG: DUF1549 domain-containing protein [Planctomycetota bacterium]
MPIQIPRQAFRLFQPINSLVVAHLLILSIASRLNAAVDFEKDLAPLLLKRCVECHQGNEPAGGLLLTSKAGFHAGGDSGPVFEVKDLAESEFLRRIESGEMPPEKQGQSQELPQAEKDIFRKWLEEGVPWPKDRRLDYFERTNEVRAGRDWWSLQPIVRPQLPSLKKSPPPDNPIDAFVRSKLESKGIDPAPQADKRELVRRLYYDLIGLPPTRKQVNAFLADRAPDAWERLVDRLLASPQYGERWARYWLDIARYADTSGYERDQEKPFAWKYRDWVVDALNRDMPYDDFVVQQIAGDEIPGRSESSVIATGFLRLGTWNDEPNDKLDYQYERLEDLVHTTSSTFLGLTVKCARCHSHKFDPITQEDYYRVASAFWPGPILTGELGGPKANQLGYEEVLGWTDESSTPKPLHVLKNGERGQPMREVVPASISSIPSLERKYEPPGKEAKTSQRRLQFARWVVDRHNPLPARVLVNRLWQHHFGRAIVRTPNNFGFLAEPPTHPQLLDWLAAEFQAGELSIKHMHRLLLNSETWRQSSSHPRAEELERVDPTNRLLWRFGRRRLDAEALRDSLLAASGDLDRRVGGEGFKASVSPEALEGLSRKAGAWQASPPETQMRRSLYMYLKRGLLPPMMTTFDLCDPTLSCGKRDVTTVPTQSLALLNNRFVHERSEQLAVRISSEVTDGKQQVRLVWSQVLGREPTVAEGQAALRHLESQTRLFAKQQSLQKSRETNFVDNAQTALVMHLRADQAKVVAGSDSLVSTIPDLSKQGRDATQEIDVARPTLIEHGFGEKPTLQFNGAGQFLHIAGQVLDAQEHTVFCVVSDEASSGHRAILSNWNGGTVNSTTSVFVGLTAEKRVRFSDAFSNAGDVSDRGKPFILTTVSGMEHATVFQNGRKLKSGPPLTKRRLDTAWVIGQQGNINGEFWNGGIAEIRVYDRELSSSERRAVEEELAAYYGLVLARTKAGAVLSPNVLALASVCHALMNSNEFLYVD